MLQALEWLSNFVETLGLFILTLLTTVRLGRDMFLLAWLLPKQGQRLKSLDVSCEVSVPRIKQVLLFLLTVFWFWFLQDILVGLRILVKTGKSVKAATIHREELRQWAKQ